MSTQFAVSSIIDDDSTFDGRTPRHWLRRLATPALLAGLVIGGCVMGSTGPPLTKCRTALPTADVQPLAQAKAELVAPLRRSAAAPALDFNLSKSTRAQVRAWATERGMQCTTAALGRLVHCDAGGADGPTHFTFKFDAAGHVTTVDRVHTGMAFDAAQARFETASTRLDHEVGNATAVVGAGRGFVTAAYQRSVRDYDYAGYRATVTATHFGKQGIQLRERYSLSR